MDLHKILMGNRWPELPAQTVMDEKVSKFIGNVIIATTVSLFVSLHVNVYQRKRIKELERK